MQVRIVGAHSLDSKHAHHNCFLIDGHVAVDAGSIMSALAADEQERIEAVLLTHHHFDHCRDLPTLALDSRDAGRTVQVYGEPPALRVTNAQLLDGRIYVDATRAPKPGVSPPLSLRPFAVDETHEVLGYRVSAVRVDHPVPTMGYIVSDGGLSVGFSGDTGGALMNFFAHPTPPDVLLIDVKWPERMRAVAEASGHMTPGMLREEVLAAKEAGVALPKLLAVHRSLREEPELLRELAALQAELNVDLEPGYEDMVIG